MEDRRTSTPYSLRAQNKSLDARPHPREEIANDLKLQSHDYSGAEMNEPETMRKCIAFS